MEVCYEIHLEGDRAMNISATPVIDSADYSARSSTCGNENNGKIILVYDHCKKQWHIKEHCYKLHGCPPGDKKRSSNEKQNTWWAYVNAKPSQSPDSHGNQTNPSATTSGAIVQSSIPQCFGLISVDGKNSWTLDSSATNCFIGSFEHFVFYIPCACNKTIRIADDFLALPLLGKGRSFSM